MKQKYKLSFQKGKCGVSGNLSGAAINVDQVYHHWRSEKEEWGKGDILLPVIRLDMYNKNYHLHILTISIQLLIQSTVCS